MTDQQPAPEENNREVGEPESKDSGSAFKFRDYALEDYLVLIVFWALAGVVFAQFSRVTF